MLTRFAWLAAIPLVAGAVTAQAKAAVEPTTTCDFGGPTGTYSALRLDLPTGSDFLTLRAAGTRPSRPAATSSSWHLAEGIFVVDATTGGLAAYRIATQGTNPRQSIVTVGGASTGEQPTPGPDAPFQYATGSNVPYLSPGSYWVISFGSDGDSSAPNDWWRTSVETAGTRACTEVTTGGTVFDVNHTEFSGGMQVSSPALSAVSGATYQTAFDPPFVVGIMQATSQVTGSATLGYTIPTGTGQVSDDIAAFASSAGRYSWTANANGVAPLIDIAGLAINLAN